MDRSWPSKPLKAGSNPVGGSKYNGLIINIKYYFKMESPMLALFLALAALLLLAVIAVQNYANPALRQETISDGLYSTVPDHWLLDGAYVVLATALALNFTGHNLAQVLALVTCLSLMVTAASNTFSVWVDKVTNGLHDKIHTMFTIVMFLAVLALEATQNHGWLWWLSAAGIALPGVVYGLCAWLVAGPATRFNDLKRAHNPYTTPGSAIPAADNHHNQP